MFVVLYVYVLSSATILLNWQSQNISAIFDKLKKVAANLVVFSVKLTFHPVYWIFGVLRLKTYSPELGIFTLIVTPNQTHVAHRKPRISWARYSIISVMHLQHSTHVEPFIWKVSWSNSSSELNNFSYASRKNLINSNGKTVIILQLIFIIIKLHLTIANGLGRLPFTFYLSMVWMK